MNQKISLTRYLVEQQRSDGSIPAQLRLLLEVVARACKSISQAVNKGALGGVLGSAESENVQGEVQKKLDIIANEVLIEANEWGGHLAAMASEEMDSIHLVPNRYPQGEYLLLFDPLDGSSNIDVNVSIGTIFSVLKKPENGSRARRAGIRLPAGRQQAGGGRLLHLRPADHAGAHRGQRRCHVHAGPRAGILHAHAGRHPDSGRHQGIRHQHEQPAPLGRAGASATSTNAWPARMARAARTSTCAGSPAWWPTCTAS